MPFQTKQKGNNIRKKHPPLFKKRVSVAMIKQQDPVAQICSNFSIHPSQAHAWKKVAEKSIEAGFAGTLSLESQNKEKDQLIEDLFRQIGQLTYEQDWLKKKLGYTS